MTGHYESEEFNMQHDDDPYQRFFRIKSYIILGILAWTVIMTSSLIWNIPYTKNHTLVKADALARLAFEKGLPIRNLERNQIAFISGLHALLWGLGFAGIILFGKGILKSEKERSKMELDLRDSEKKLAKVFRASPDWITITTLEEGRYIDVNDAFMLMTGYTRDEAIGKNAMDLGLWVNPEIGSAVLEMLREKESLHTFEIELRMKSGRIQTMVWSAEKIELKGQHYLINAIKDVTVRKEMEQEIKRIAYHDTLTGLPNRMLLMDRLTVAISQADRDRKKVALMMLDLDKFKEVNDALGHHIGDLLLKAIAEKLKSLLRKGDTVARFGGDEFVLVFPGQEDAKAALQVAGKIIDAFQEAITLDGHSLTITTSIGISLYPDHGADIDTILQNADNVMYQAKQSGRNRYQLYNEA